MKISETLVLISLVLMILFWVFLISSLFYTGSVSLSEIGIGWAMSFGLIGLSQYQK